MRHPRLFLLVLPFLLAPLCPQSGTLPVDGDTDAETDAGTWFSTCGDPVCSGYSGPFDDVPLCADEAEGDVCDSLDAECDPESDCNARLVCAETDPKDQPGGCPISRKTHKKNIRYLDVQARRAASEQALSMPLATWTYSWEEDQTHLGFLIDDVEGSPAVRSDGEHVDLYGYTSLAIAALQEQQAQIDALKAEVDALKACQ